MQQGMVINPILGVYIPILRISITEGGMSYPQYRELIDPGKSLDPGKSYDPIWRSHIWKQTGWFNHQLNE